MSKFIRAADIKALIKNVKQVENDSTKKQTKIITVGDSITFGSYPALLSMMLNAEKPADKTATYNY